MEKPIEKENKNEYVVIGLAISQESQIDGQAYLKSEIHLGKYNEPIHFFEHFLAAVR